MLTCNFNENNEERSHIRKQISKFLVTDGCQFGQSYSINNSMQDGTWCSTGCTKRHLFYLCAHARANKMCHVPCCLQTVKLYL